MTTTTTTPPASPAQPSKEEQPAVECPVGDFFASGWGTAWNAPAS